MQPRRLPSTIVPQAEALAAAGRSAEAILLLNRAGAAGDADALFTLATWRMAGTLMPRDFAAARDLFRRAGEAGRLDAAKVHSNFLASGTGGTVDWPGALKRLSALAKQHPASKAELDLIRRMDLTDDGGPKVVPEREPVSDSPAVWRIPRLFSPAECAWLIKVSEPQLQPSVVVDERTGRQVPNPIRTSDGTSFPFMILNPAVQALNRRIAAASGTDFRQGEPLQVLRYKPGQQYRTHLDAVPGLDSHRFLTLLVYLNDGYEGGELHFPQAGLTLKGRTGDAVMFRNTLPDGRPDRMSEHAGLPVTRGTKWLASRWIWTKEFLLPPPQLRS
jgi:prolyl 4-hydroxylase